MLSWTLELDVALCDSVVAGKAWSEIAASLHLTRDQVARRASRLGLKRGIPFQDAARRVRVWDKHRKVGSARFAQRHETKKSVARKPAVLHKVRRVEWTEIREIPRSKHNVTFLALEPHHCRYPIGDPKTKEFRFCGALRLDGKPYCARCLEIASIPKGTKRQGWRAISAERVTADRYLSFLGHFAFLFASSATALLIISSLS
jgi:GcrA cell cycle regulator